jgi:hypothetical protein
LPRQGKRDLAKEQFWRKALTRFAASGKSASQFCVEEGLSPATFNYWERAIKERNNAAQIKPTAPPENEQSDFVAVMVKDKKEEMAPGVAKPVAEVVFAGGGRCSPDGAELGGTPSLGGARRAK